ncbi:hypothetical protein E5288_WYG017873 [Bos mutus]|uniref:Uncharacterized protein n=1 Tax=Bos mutus TaxID=72004 RepID=A0A6B0SD84_9CETA|nr:hypothetical protein [Bos mutus]
MKNARHSRYVREQEETFSCFSSLGKGAAYRDRRSSALFPGAAAPGGPEVAALSGLRVCGPFTPPRHQDYRRLRHPISDSR